MNQLKELNKTAGIDFGTLFVEEVRSRLMECRGDWPRLIALSEGTLTRPWLASFSQGRIAAPSFPLIVNLAMLLGIRVKVTECRHFKDVKPAYRP